MAQPTYPPPKPDAGSETPAALRQHTQEIARAVIGLYGGKINAVSADFTLTANTVTSVFTDARLTQQGVALFDPLTANAAAALAAGTLFAATAGRNAGSWSITHANNAQTDRTFRVLIVG